MPFFKVIDKAIAREFIDLQARRDKWRDNCLKFFGRHGFSRTELGIGYQGFPSAMLTKSTRGRTRQPDLTEWKCSEGQFYHPRKRSKVQADYEALGVQPRLERELEERVGFTSERRACGSDSAHRFERTALCFQVLPTITGVPVVVLFFPGWAKLRELKGCKQMSGVEYERLLKRSNEEGAA